MGRYTGVGALKLAVLGMLVMLSSAWFRPESLARVTHPSRPPAQAKRPRLDGSLAQLASSEAESVQKLADEAGVSFIDGFVQILVMAEAGATANAERAIESLGGRVTGIVPSEGWLQAWLPVDGLTALANNPAVAYVRVPDRAWLDDEHAPTETMALADSLSLMGLPLWHLSGYQGQGIKIGIIDVGFGGHRALLGGALPAQVVARTLVDGENDDHLNTGSNHGTAVAEIVHRIAPEAELYLAKIATVVDLHEAAAWLMDEVGVHVIHSSPRWYALSPGDGTGAFASLAHAARARGIVWVAPAGDARILHWSGEWADYEEGGWLDWETQAHINWLMLDGQYNLPPGMPIDVWLRWSDWEQVDQDLDLCLYQFGHHPPEEVVCSSDPQTGLSGQTPTERLRGWTADYPRVYGIGVHRVHGDRPLHIDLFVAGVTNLYYRTHGHSLADMADAPGVLSTSAVSAWAPFEQPAYSSEGPTKGPGGTAASGLAKPDLAAYAGVATSSRGPFAGTAAAAAHATGAVAVVQSAQPSWSPEQVHAFLCERALDLGPPGWDPVHGHGRLHLGNPSTAPPVQYWFPVVRR
jgi:subtilisin family serine protease